MPDRVQALISYLGAQPAISRVAGRIFADELPDHIVSMMPVIALVIRPAGGGSAYGGGYQQFSEERLDIHHYAGTPQAARLLFEDTKQVLKQMPRNRQGDTLLHWAHPAGGPTSMREPGPGWPGGVPDNTIHWPFTVASWTVLAADIALA